MDNLTEILNLVEAAVSGNQTKGAAYAMLLAEKLESTGEVKAAARVRRAVDVHPLTQVSAADIVNARDIRLPVDTESRLALADEQAFQIADTAVYLDEAIHDLIEEFVRYVGAADQLQAEGLGISPTILLYGPPGCGKTQIARHLASRLQLPLVTARVDTLISSFLGSTSKNIRLLFDHVARRRCILFLDEFDAIAKLRDDGHELGELKRVVVSLLQNIDAVEGKSIIVAATNHSHLLDPAIWRRFAYRLNIKLPDESARKRMFRSFLADGVSGRSVDKFAKASTGLSGSDIRQLCDGARRAAIVDGLDAVPDGYILKRLLVRGVDGDGLSVPELIVRAKQQLPSVYTHRVLAEAFSMSPGNVTHILHRWEDSQT